MKTEYFQKTIYKFRDIKNDSFRANFTYKLSDESESFLNDSNEKVSSKLKFAKGPIVNDNRIARK